ncbi:MAG TPA: nitrous oxide reductase accessory protein NosL [Pirellulales bacterium]|jgi:hypothetical protein|nr:nitrous oxide reductase accessory protein NosL [Pirellulales bacterium]
MGKRFWWASTLVAVSAVLLPWFGTWSRRQKLPQCALDGIAIVPIYAVEVVDADRQKHCFCCLRCAEYWLAQEPSPPSAVYVTDEVSGQPIDASEAFFVRSPVVTNPVTGNRIHAFEKHSDADDHAAQFRGRLLTAGERPFEVRKADEDNEP